MPLNTAHYGFIADARTLETTLRERQGQGDA